VRGVAVVAVSDLIFQSRIREALAGLGLDMRVADSPRLLREATAAGPALVVVDLQDSALDPRAAIAAAKLAGARVLAFGRHTDAATMREARAAGADTVVARSQLAEGLPALIEALVGVAPDADSG